jgi:hypothetical protein
MDPPFVLTCTLAEFAWEIGFAWEIAFAWEIEFAWEIAWVTFSSYHR